MGWDEIFMRKRIFCIICKQEILKKTEKWVRLTDFDCGIEGGEICYHLECWKERFKITNSERKKQMYSQAMQGIQNIISRGGILLRR